ncbi:NUDIX domain-containing protein, partial [Francisella orientalis]
MPSGHYSFETFEQCIRREVYEEVSIIAKSESFYFRKK